MLADDDMDDCALFTDALDELAMPVTLATVHDGAQLMQYLVNEAMVLPNVLFLDLNMPRKNGIECLAEIKVNERLKQMPVMIFSTSFDREVMQSLYRNGAQHYVRKPDEFEKLKKVMYKVLNLLLEAPPAKTTAENFVIEP